MDVGRRSLSLSASKQIYGPIVGLLEGCIGVNAGACIPWVSKAAPLMRQNEEWPSFCSLEGPGQCSVPETPNTMKKVGVSIEIVSI